MGKRKRVAEPSADDEQEHEEEQNQNLEIGKWTLADRRLIVLLEGAQLETVKNGKNFELLNCDDHAGILRKNGRDPGSCRPDIAHQCLLMLMDSPLNRSGFLQIYIHTENNVLIEIHPKTRIPRTFKRFSGLMVQLLHKFSIRATEGSMKLLKVIANPITKHLPVGVRKITMSVSADKIVNPIELVPDGNEPVVIIIGAMAHGKVDVDFSEECLSISKFPLSGALTCTKICSAFEEKWIV